MGRRAKKKKSGKPAAGLVKSPWSQEQVDAFVAARDRAASGNPRLVRRAFICGDPLQIGTLSIGPLTIGAFYMLEDAGHPFACPDAKDRNAFYRDVAEAAYVLAEPRSARRGLQIGPEAFRAGALDFAGKIPLDDAQAVLGCVVKRIAEAMDTMPGGGGSSKGDLKDEKGKNVGTPNSNPGLGWGLTLFHQLLATYGGTPDYWRWECPLSLAFALFAAIQASSGAKPTGPSYAEIEMLEALRGSAPKSEAVTPPKKDKKRAKR